MSLNKKRIFVRQKTWKKCKRTRKEEECCNVANRPSVRFLTFGLCTTSIRNVHVFQCCFAFPHFFSVSFSMLCSVLFKRKKILTRSKCSQDKNWEIFVDVVCAGVFYFLKKNFFSISRFAVSVSLQFECVIVCSISSNIFFALKGALLRNDNVLLIHVLCDIDDNFEAFSHRNLMFTRWQ